MLCLRIKNVILLSNKIVRNYISSKRVCGLNQFVLNVILQKYAAHSFRRNIISNNFFEKKDHIFDSKAKHRFEFTCLLLFIEFLQRVCFWFLKYFFYLLLFKCGSNLFKQNLSYSYQMFQVRFKNNCLTNKLCCLAFYKCYITKITYFK